MYVYEISMRLHTIRVQCCWVRHSEDLVSYHSTMAHVPFDDQFFSHPQQQQGGIVRNSVV